MGHQASVINGEHTRTLESHQASSRPCSFITVHNNTYNSLHAHSADTLTFFKFPHQYFLPLRVRSLPSPWWTGPLCPRTPVSSPAGLTSGRSKVCGQPLPRRGEAQAELAHKEGGGTKYEVLPPRRGPARQPAASGRWLFHTWLPWLRGFSTPAASSSRSAWPGPPPASLTAPVPRSVPAAALGLNAQGPDL